MQIRKIGQQPSDQFHMQPNALSRDALLSFRARGVMDFINSHADGFHLNADSLTQHGTEGRDAIRAAMNELIERGYLRRVRRQDEQGRWRTDLNVYIFGDAPPIVGKAPDPVTDGDLDTPTTGFQASVDQSPVDQSVLEDQVEDSTALPSDAAGDHSPPEVPTGQQPDFSQVVKPFPFVEQRKLVQWFGITDPKDVEAWQGVWTTAQTHGDDETYYDPSAHLAIYLSRCREERRRPRSDLWLRFFVEDRAKHVVALAEEARRIDHHHETPQEREDRYNRRQFPDRSELGAS